MVGDYISREAALTVLDWDCASQDALEAINSIPAADVVEVRHRHWERVDGYPYPACSECGCESLSRADRPYCQFCGARMDGGQDDV